MAINYATSLDNFSDKVDSVDDRLAEHVNTIQEAIVAIETKVGADSSAVTSTIDYKINNFFTTGRTVWLYEDTAPTGWSVVATTDRVIGVKGGADAYNISGGNAGGTWTIAGESMAHTHAGPNHVHIWYGYVGGGSDHSHNSAGSMLTLDASVLKASYAALVTTTPVGYSAYPYSYDYFTYLSGTGNTSAASSSTVSSTGAWRANAAVGIIVSKD